MRRFAASLAFCLAMTHNAIAADDAEIRARRVPYQRYLNASDRGFAILELGLASWDIPLWAIDPATLAIIKVLGNSAPAPYAITISPTGNNPIDDIETNRRIYTVHLLAASLADAVKIRKALIAEIETAQRFLEKRQGNKPGFLKAAARAQK